MAMKKAKKAGKKSGKKSAKKSPAKKAAKKTTKKAVKRTVKKAAKKKTARKPNERCIHEADDADRPVGAIIGSSPMPRTEVTSQIWKYIKRNNLQDKANRRMINADEKLRALFGKAQASMFELTKYVSKHLR